MHPDETANLTHFRVRYRIDKSPVWESPIVLKAPLTTRLLAEQCAFELVQSGRAQSAEVIQEQPVALTRVERFGDEGINVRYLQGRP